MRHLSVVAALFLQQPTTLRRKFGQENPIESTEHTEGTEKIRPEVRGSRPKVKKSAQSVDALKKRF